MALRDRWARGRAGPARGRGPGDQATVPRDHRAGAPGSTVRRSTTAPVGFVTRRAARAVRGRRVCPREVRAPTTRPREVRAPTTRGRGPRTPPAARTRAPRGHPSVSPGRAGAIARVVAGRTASASTRVARPLPTRDRSGEQPAAGPGRRVGAIRPARAPLRGRGRARSFTRPSRRLRRRRPSATVRR
jgi:hypothetical protein